MLNRDTGKFFGLLAISLISIPSVATLTFFHLREPSVPDGPSLWVVVAASDPEIDFVT